MDQVCLCLILVHYLLHRLILSFIYVIPFVFPQFKKNLISVHHFTKHNNLYLEFHLTYFLVKDRITGAILLKGECEDGVYPFPEHLRPNFKNAVAYVHERTTLDGWHKRLGHPSSKLVNHLIHVFSLPTNKNGH